MAVATILIFAGALLAGAASPGPGVLALVARVIGNGIVGTLPFIAGLVLGDLIWLAATVVGLALLAEMFHQVFVAVKFIGAAYLLYLAVRMWFAPARASADDRAPSTRGSISLFVAGLLVTLGNPKVMAFYLALLPNLIELGQVDVVGYLELASVAVLILTVVFGAYALAALRARVIFRSPRALRLLNRTGAGLMAGAAVAVATK
jgi:threonine/homoserine/homoserine lactone efflux protein